MGAVHVNPSDSLVNLNYRLQKCQFIISISIFPGFLLHFLKKKKQASKREVERRIKRRRKEIIGVRKKVRKRKKGRRK